MRARGQLQRGKAEVLRQIGPRTRVRPRLGRAANNLSCKSRAQQRYARAFGFGLTGKYGTGRHANVAHEIAGFFDAGFFSEDGVHRTIATGGSLESDSLQPVGEYAMAALGRERLFQYYSEQLQIPTLLVRLNYATELGYGVLVDIATSVLHDQSMDVTTGFVNVIWQGDANAMTLRCLELPSIPIRPINLTGPVGLNVRNVAQQVAALVGVALDVTGTERSEALLSQAAHNYELLGAPQMDLETMLRWTVQWLQQGGESLGKPTKFNAADGKF